MESATAAPLCSLEAIYKPPASTVGVIRSTSSYSLEPENARERQRRLAMPTPLLDRMLVDEPWPDRDGARVPAAVAAGVPDRDGFEAVGDGALDSILLLAPRRMRRVLELACGFAAAARRSVLSREDVRGVLDLAGGDRRRPAGFLPRD